MIAVKKLNALSMEIMYSHKISTTQMPTILYGLSLKELLTLLILKQLHHFYSK
jgi:hypothetical protein